MSIRDFFRRRWPPAARPSSDAVEVSLEQGESPSLYVGGFAWAQRNDPARYRDYGTHDERLADGIVGPGEDVHVLDVSHLELPVLPLAAGLDGNAARSGEAPLQTVQAQPPVAVYWNPAPWPTVNGRPMRLLLVNPRPAELAWLESKIDALGGALIDADEAAPLQEQLVELRAGRYSTDCGLNVFHCLETGRLAVVLTHT